MFNRVKYSGMDFESALEEFKLRLLQTHGVDYNELAKSDLGVTLLDLVAFAVDTLAFYQNQRSAAAFLSTSKARRETALGARQLGYKAKGAVSSSVDLKVTLGQVYPMTVTIPKGFQFQSTDGTVFEVFEDVLFASGELEQYVSCYEGETLTETFVSDGSPFQRFALNRIPDGKFLTRVLSVSVGGESWSEVDFLSYGDTTRFEVDYGDFVPVVAMGDSIAGSIPTSNATIAITYVASKGRLGQVAEDTIKSTKTALVVNFTRIAMSVTNEAKPTGGVDQESLESIRTLAPRLWKTRDVAVTEEDHQSLAQAFADPLAGRVAVAKAISARSADGDLGLRSMLADLVSLTTVPAGAIRSLVVGGLSALGELSAGLVDVRADVSTVSTKSTEIEASLSAAVNAVRTTKNRVNEVSNDSTDIDAAALTGRTLVDGVSTAGTSQLTSADKSALLGYFDLIRTEATQIGNICIQIRASADQELVTIGAAQNRVEDLLLLTASMDSQLSGLSNTQVVVLSTTLNGINALAQGSGQQAVNLSRDLLNHVGSYLSRDCMANLVTIPILTVDSAGFYTVPSVALLRSLQTYLDARKEVTQTVKVVSGEDYLVNVNLRVRLGVLPGNSVQTTELLAKTAVEAVLRGRGFGKSLYLEELYTALKVVKPYTKFVNVEIEGDQYGTTRLDSDGNLLVSEEEIVTKGSLFLSAEAVSG